MPVVEPLGASTGLGIRKVVEPRMRGQRGHEEHAAAAQGRFRLHGVCDRMPSQTTPGISEQNPTFAFI